MVTSNPPQLTLVLLRIAHFHVTCYLFLSHRILAFVLLQLFLKDFNISRHFCAPPPHPHPHPPA